MHELAICQALLDQVQAVAAEHADADVSRITLCVGPLSGVVPELLDRAFYLARAGGPAAHAELVIESTEIRVRCRVCGAESEATPAHLICGVCGDFHTDLLVGDQLVLKRVELIQPGATSANESAGGQPCVKHADAI
ncbi:MAG: hydrogenase maturation nickel metallochaperone HypA [Gammaproteobacteria bacterium]